MINSLSAVIPVLDEFTGLKKTVTHSRLVIGPDLHMDHEKKITFKNADDTEFVADNMLEKQMFSEKTITTSTVNKFVDLTGKEVPEGTAGAINELEFYQSIPIVAFPGIQGLSNSTKAELAQSGITIAELVYWLITNTMITGSTVNDNY